MSEKQLSNNKSYPRLKIDDIDVLHRPWRQCWCNFETLVGTNIQTAHLAGHRLVRIQWSDNTVIQSLSIAGGMMESGIVISQHNGGSQRELLLASPLSQCFLTCFTCAPPWAFCIDTHIAEVHLPVPQAALNAFQAITLPVRHGNGNRKMRQWHSEQSAIPTKY